ncbi:helix-turn-helix domain-containing protein [Flavobacterium reichenbachii]|uniref:AraC family transcriptional regulator n=1 Tax=Flavobacterium reichenbachii TaxID=362418 RepID=A0A085ZM03_9FLAO|nr:response regulator transcription factor [Flavobacterium reichenbachii]KFF05467.1 AraC family transcriptional regulator [Flavobacterium reichenbachii]OXB17807.1 AraC family transcriptional regulator [Flavobacterium reichenbachii]
MANNQPHRIKSISEFHEFRNLPKPEHPLISVYNFEDLKYLNKEEPKSLMLDFYSIALKRNANAKMRYGQQEYDFKEGVLIFLSPGQVFSIEGNAELQHTGWSLLIHPDFLWNTPLAQKIKQYDYFDYAVNEALHLSDKEENMLIDIVRNIQQEYQSNIDKFSQDVIIAQIELFLTYAERFYNRQFITRKISSHQILARLEKLLHDYFVNDSLAKIGLPTVQYIADNLNVSPNYLSGLLKMHTGQSTQQHIHDKLIEKAKEKLSTTNLSISEIAFELGFEHQQSFSKLFKTKTNVSPLEFRQSFN